MPNRPSALHDWLASPQGRSLVTAEAELLGEVLDDVFGWELLQIGMWGPARALLGTCRTRRQTIASSAPVQPGVDILARLPQLPIASDTVDNVLVPHTLEFESDPQAVIREVDRVLVGEGQLIVLGFRPFSLWGLRSRASQGDFPPGIKRLLSEGRVRDWLALLGYEIVLSRHYLYRSPWRAPSTREDATGRLLHRGLTNPFPAGAYVLKARKRLYTMTPIKPRLRERPVIGQLVKPTTRSSS